MHNEIPLSLVQSLFGEEDPYFVSLFGEGEESSKKLDELHQRLEEAMARLPPKEADMIYFHYSKGKKQNDIAKILNVTQAAVSYRLKRARARLDFFLTVPDLKPDELTRLLTPYFSSSDVKILVGMAETTCQSVVANRLNLTQGRVRHRFFRAVKDLETLCLKDEKLKAPYQLFSRIADKGFNLSREVRLPQWENRGIDTCDLTSWPGLCRYLTITYRS